MGGSLRGLVLEVNSRRRKRGPPPPQSIDKRRFSRYSRLASRFVDQGDTHMTRTLVAEPESQVEAEAPAACCTSVAAPDVSGEQAQTLADVFKAPADPTRVRIVNMLV